MEVSKKRKRDVDCPIITYDAATRVFDRLFKEESLEEMKNVVRKKLGLSLSLPVHLSQLRGGKSVVLEDDDDFDAFYASVHSNAVARIKVHFDDDQLGMAGPDSAMQLSGSPTVYHTAVDGHTSSKKRKVAFFEPTPQPVGENVEEADPSPNFEAPVQSDVAAVEASASNSKRSTETVHVSEITPHNAVKSKKRRKTSAITDDAADTAGYPRVSKKSKDKHKDSKDGAADPTDDNQADTRTKLPEASQPHTPSIAQADPEVISTGPPKETRKSIKKVEVVIVDKGPKDALSTPISATSNGTVAVKHTKKNPKPPAAISALETNSKGKTENPGPSQGSKTPAKPTPNEDDTQCEQKTTASAEGKKKSRINGAPVESVETNSTQDPGPKFDLKAANRAAVAAISRKLLSKPVSSLSPLADGIAPSPSVAPVTSSSPENHLIPPNTNTTAEQPNAASKCPVCNKTPSHFRSRCPIIKAGVRSMRQRIAELQRDTSEGNDEERKKVIEELQRIIEKRTQVNQAPTTKNKSTDLNSMADKPIIGDVSSYTALDLEALIRGPNITLADVPSSDSSGEEEVLEEEPEEVQIELSRFQGRMQYPSSSEEEEEEEEEEASPFVPSIIPLPIRSLSELPDEDESSRSEDIPEPSEHGHKVIGDILSALDDGQVPDDSEPQMASDVARPPVTIATPRPTPQSDPIEAFEQLEASSPPSPIVSMEEDIHPLQSTPKTQVASRKTADLTSKPSRMGVNGVSNHSISMKKPGGLTRIMDLSVPINPALKVIKPVGVQTRRQTARAEEEEEEEDEEADEQGPTTVTSQARRKNGQSSGSKTLPSTTKTPAEITKTPAKTPAKTPVKTPAKPSAKTPAKPSAKTPTKTPAKTLAKTSATRPKVPIHSNVETRTPTVVQNALETKKSAISNSEQSLASWAVLEGESLAESEPLKMVDELSYSPDFPTLAQRSVSSTLVNGVSKAPDALFLHSESQQSFPYSQYPNFPQAPPGSEDEEDEVQASVVKPQTTTKSSSKFRSLTEIASQPALFTTMSLTNINSTKEEAMNLYGRTSKGEEESGDSDTSESEAEARAQTSHIPLSRRAGSSF